MTRHDEKEPPVYAAGERAKELADVTYSETRARRLLAFWGRRRTGGNRCPGSGGPERVKALGFGCPRAAVRGPGLCWLCSAPVELNGGRELTLAVEGIEMSCACPRCHATPDAVRVPRNTPTQIECQACGERWTISWGKVEAV